MAVRINQAATEFVVLQNPNVRICQAVVEFITFPFTPPPTYTTKITLRGVKRFRCDPSEAGPSVTEVPNLPSVKRAV
jgi:hypothetical protein